MMDTGTAASAHRKHWDKEGLVFEKALIAVYEGRIPLDKIAASLGRMNGKCVTQRIGTLRRRRQTHFSYGMRPLPGESRENHKKRQCEADKEIDLRRLAVVRMEAEAGAQPVSLGAPPRVLPAPPASPSFEQSGGNGVHQPLVAREMDEAADGGIIFIAPNGNEVAVKHLPFLDVAKLLANWSRVVNLLSDL
jgi:hypothetical protein